MTFDPILIEHTRVEEYKTKVKKIIRGAAFKFLKAIQNPHSKVKDIIYGDIKTQSYLKSPLFSESSLLYALRSRTDDVFKANF